MLQFIKGFNLLIFALFTVFYAYQLFYVLAALWHDRKKTPMPPAKRLHKYAAVISARNESTVIGELIHSIKKQNYPAELLDVFVVADKLHGQYGGCRTPVRAQSCLSDSTARKWARLCA